MKTLLFVLIFSEQDLLEIDIYISGSLCFNEQFALRVISLWFLHIFWVNHWKYEHLDSVGHCVSEKIAAIHKQIILKTFGVK